MDDEEQDFNYCDPFKEDLIYQVNRLANELSKLTSDQTFLYENNVDQIIESDFLRWILLCGGEREKFIRIAIKNISLLDLKNYYCRLIYEILIKFMVLGEKYEIVKLSNEFGTDGKRILFFKNLLDKRINYDKKEEHFKECVIRILQRNLNDKKEAIKKRIQTGSCSDEEALKLVQEFEELRKINISIKK